MALDAMSWHAGREEGGKGCAASPAEEAEEEGNDAGERRGGGRRGRLVRGAEREREAEGSEGRGGRLIRHLSWQQGGLLRPQHQRCRARRLRHLCAHDYSAMITQLHVIPRDRG